MSNKKQVYDPSRHCGATKKRGGGKCTQVKGARTGHKRSGRCWLHGGRSPIKHGIYSETMSGRARIRGLIDKIDSTIEDIDSLRPEAILLKALVVDNVERYDKLSQQLDAWHTSFDPPFVQLMSESDPNKVIALVNELRKTITKRPRQLPDPVGISTVIDRIRKITETIHKMQTEDSMTRSQVEIIVERLAVVVAQEVPDEMMGVIESRWRRIPE